MLSCFNKKNTCFNLQEKRTPFPRNKDFSLLSLDSLTRNLLLPLEIILKIRSIQEKARKVY